MLDAIDTSKFALHGTISIDPLRRPTAIPGVGKEQGPECLFNFIIL